MTTGEPEPQTIAKSSAYRTILVEAEPPALADRRLICARALADRFQATLVGIGAEPVPSLAGLDPLGESLALWRAEVAAELAAAKENFQRIVAERKSEWRESLKRPEQAMYDAAGAADLIVAGGVEQAEQLSGRTADVGELVLRAGRPVLVASLGRSACEADRVVIAWKDRREARRAAWDAMPFLLEASDVLVLAIAEDDDLSEARESAADAALALRRHGVAARGEAQKQDDCGIAGTLIKRADALGADLIVSGAFGHSRLGEWVFGGVTRALLAHTRHHLLLSH
jgi:nucleotide-binding universal stress UspA family protein